MEAIAQAFPEVLVLNDQTIGSGKPSTVLKWLNQDWQILRQGQVRVTNN